MRLLFCSTGGAGHLLPLRPLAAALRAQGHTLAWATAPDALHHLQTPELQGVEAFAIGPTFDDSRRQFRQAFPAAAGLAGEALAAYTFPRLFGAILAPAMLDGLEQVLQQWRPDGVLHEPAALAVPLACHRHDLPHAAQGYGLRLPAEHVAAAMEWFGASWRARGATPPPDGGLYRHLYLDVVPRRLQAVEPGRLLHVNPYARAAAPPALPPPMQAALQGPRARGPRLYLTFGTVFNGSPALPSAVAAAVRLGGTLVVTVGPNGDPNRFAGLPGSVHVARFVDQAAVLPHCDAVVSHGGAGTAFGAAAHGLPQLLLPQAADHFRNARALCAAQAAQAVEPELQTVDGLEAALRGLVASAAVAAGAQGLARDMAEMPDADTVARQIGRWLTGVSARP